MTGRTRWCAAAITSLVLMLSSTRRGQAAGAADEPRPTPQDAAALFQSPRPWSVELRLTPEAFAAMEPKGGGSMLSLMGTMMVGDRRGPADLLAAAMFKRGDRDRDGKLDRQEVDALAGRWFELWDNTRSGKLDLDTLRAGLKATVDPEAVFESKFPVFLRSPDGKPNGLAAALGIEFVSVRATIAFEGAELRDVAVRYKGNGTFLESRQSLKRSLKLDFNDFVKGRRLAGLAKLNLHNNVTDASGMVEPMSFQLYRDAGVPAPRTTYAEVFLTVPPKHDATYLGLYSVVENVDKDFIRDRFGGAKGGALCKPTTPNLFADLGETWDDFKQTYEPKTDVSEAQARRVMELAKLMSYATDADLAARVGDYIDLDNFSRFMAVTVYLSSLDSILQIGQNYYLYLDPRTDKFHFIPWDHDHSFGRLFADQDELARMTIHRPWPGPNRFLDRMFKVPAFKELYLARLREFSETIFAPERLAARVDEIAAAIRPSVEGESEAKLASFDQAVEDKPRTRALKFVKGFSRLRTQSIRDQLAGKSEGVRPKFAGPGAGGGDERRGSGAGGGTAGKPQGRTLAGALLGALDADRDEHVTRAEFTEGLGRSFSNWSKGHEAGLTEEQLRHTIRTDLFPSSQTPPAQQE